MLDQWNSWILNILRCVTLLRGIDREKYRRHASTVTGKRQKHMNTGNPFKQKTTTLNSAPYGVPANVLKMLMY